MRFQKAVEIITPAVHLAPATIIGAQCIPGSNPTRCPFTLPGWGVANVE